MDEDVEEVQLSDRQRQIVEILGQRPRPQTQAIALGLHISRDAVKDH